MKQYLIISNYLGNYVTSYDKKPTKDILQELAKQQYEHFFMGLDDNYSPDTEEETVKQLVDSYLIIDTQKEQ